MLLEGRARTRSIRSIWDATGTGAFRNDAGRANVKVATVATFSATVAGFQVDAWSICVYTHFLFWSFMGLQ